MSKEGFSVWRTVAEMNSSPSTVSRELAHNAGQRGHRHKQAQRKAREHLKVKPEFARMTLEVVAFVEARLADDCPSGVGQPQCRCGRRERS